MGVLLGRHMEKVNRAHAWRKEGVVATLTPAQLSTDIAIFESESCTLPAAQAQALVSRLANEKVAALDWAGMWAVVEPHETTGNLAAFDPKEPKMKDLPRVQEWKLRAFDTYMLEGMISPRLLEGESELSSLSSMMKVLLSQFWRR